MSFKKPAAWVIAVSVVLVVALSIGFAANKASGSEISTSKPADEGSTVSAGSTGPFAGYVKDATTDTFDVYTEENGTYIMSLPVSVYDGLPTHDRTDPNWTPGWTGDVYCGTIGSFTWAVVCTGPAAGIGQENMCASMDGGETWWIGDKNAMYPGTLTGAGFVSPEVGFMSYRYFMDQGPEISRTLDGGKNLGAHACGYS